MPLMATVFGCVSDINPLLERRNFHRPRNLCLNAYSTRPLRSIANHPPHWRLTKQAPPHFSSSKRILADGNYIRRH